MGCNIKTVVDTLRAANSRNVDKNLASILGKTLGSDPSIFEEEGIEPIQDDPRATIENLKVGALESVAGMKAIVDEIDIGTDPKYKEYVKGLLDEINPEFMAAKNLYINKEAAKNGGIIDFTGIILDIAPDMNNSYKTPTEVYLHELLHSISKFAIESKDLAIYPLVTKLEQLRNAAAKVTTYKVFLPKRSDTHTAEEIATAKATYKYVFESKNSLHEFLAYGLSNKPLMNVLTRNKLTTGKETKTLFETIRDIFAKLLNALFNTDRFGTPDTTLKHQLHQLTFELMKSNNKAINNVKPRTKANSAVDYLNKTLSVSNKVLADVVNKLTSAVTPDPERVIKPLPANPSKLDYIKEIAITLPMVLFKEEHRGIREGILKALGMDPEGFVQNIVRDIQDPSELERNIEQLGMMSGTVDRMRELYVDIVRSDVTNNFTETLNQEQEEAITEIAIDTDLSALKNDFNDSEISKLLLDKEYLAKSISLYRTRLHRIDKGSFHWHNNQATGLGYYLATGKASYAQNLNANNIAAGVLTGKHTKPIPEVVALIDKLSTLMALHYSPDESKMTVGKLFTDEAKGMRHILKLYDGFKQDSSKQLFETKVNMIKGYSKELFDPNVSVQVRPLVEMQELKKDGYVLITELVKDAKDTSSTPMGLFRNTLSVTNSYNRTATRLNNIVKRGTALSDIARIDGNTFVDNHKLTTEVKRIKAETQDIVKAMQEGHYEPDPKGNLAPLLNDKGQVVDYRYLMDKQFKKAMLKQDTSVTEVLGRTLASVKDKVDTVVQNDKVLNTIINDMVTNYVDGRSIGKNGHEYVVIEKNSPIKEADEIYKLLPKDMITRINDLPTGQIAVRRDMLHNYFGFRDKSAVELLHLTNILPGIIQKVIKFAEFVWMELIKISKVDIVIRTPEVFIDNIISNFFYHVVVDQISPIKAIKMLTANSQAITRYLKIQKEITQLSVNGLIGKDVKDKIAALTADLERSPVHDIMAAGMYQAIVEDLENKNKKKSDNALVRAIQDKTTHIPQIIRKGVQWLYLTEDSAFFKLITQGTLLSDAASKATTYQILLEKSETSSLIPTADTELVREQAKKLDKFFRSTPKDLVDSLFSYSDQNAIRAFLKAPETKYNVPDALTSKALKVVLSKNNPSLKTPIKIQLRSIQLNANKVTITPTTALRTAVDAFVNYNKPPTSFEEYLNNMGLILFTKYMKRITRVVTRSMKEKPANVLLSLVGQHEIMDVSDIHDQNLFTRSYANLNQDFTDHLSRVATPSSLELLGLIKPL